MSSQPPVFELPRRHSLSAQAATAIRKAIAEGTWRESLPSERRLCELFQVSRPTIRTALRLLADESLIEIRHGRRNRLLSRPTAAAAPRSRLVLLVSHQPIAHTSLTAYQGLAEMRAHLAEHGFSTEVLICPARSACAQQRRLATFVRQNRVFCCVLISVSQGLQRWCVDHAIPALVLGSCHATVRLPSLDVDYRAVCRHAAGLLRSQGHRRLALLVPDSGMAGDLASEEGFREGSRGPASTSEADARIVRHNGTKPGIHSRLDALFAAPRPPTALLIAKPVHTLAVLTYLLRRGLRVPDDVALIVRDSDHLYEDALSHYRIEGETFAHRLTRLMLQLVNQGYLNPEPNLIFPRYVSCGTVQRILGESDRGPG
ncbi:MAG: substrate-binding domain-containing protein [Verrucomicrobia bacterium]|nr:substrate-binding domain-containing protein [Verrucomicrobiota bacterium]